MTESAEIIQSRLRRVRQGDQEAAADLWDRFFPPLAAFAAAQFRKAKAPSVDGEDAALSALAAVLQQGKQDILENVTGHDEFWRLLSRITRRKVIDRIRRQRRHKRGGNRSVSESAAGLLGLDSLAATGPTPDLIVMVDEQVELLLEALPNDEVREIVLAKLEGATNKEVAKLRRCSLSTVERRLRIARQFWLSSNDESE